MTQSIIDKDTAKILIVDDDPSVILSARKAISDLGRVIFATNGDQALDLAYAEQPDIILLDLRMPGTDGFEVCKALKSNPQTEDIPVVIITSDTTSEIEEAVFDAGAIDYIAKPVNLRVLTARVKAHLGYKLAVDMIRREAITDHLTGLRNRGNFDEQLLLEWSRVGRARDGFTLLMMDVDEFKKYNDHFGHVQGDECLRIVADLIKQSIKRPNDYVARYGGEEFVMLLPDTDMEGGVHVANMLMERIEKANIKQAPGTLRTHVTISIGCCAISPNAAGLEDISASELINAADQALYEAKSLGRARVCSTTLTSISSEISEV